MLTSMFEQKMPTFEYNFPAIRGIQAGREYYISMCPMRLIPRIFLFDEEELKPELRAQRILNRGRIPEMARYLVNNPKSYTFSALTASIDGDVVFQSLGKDNSEQSLGTLRIPMSARFVINDGQHRRAAIEEALHENPEMGDETISVVFFIDVGLKTCQQMFADLNRHAVRPTPSLGLLYDHRDEDAQLAKTVAQQVPIFADLTELERSSISNRSVKLFTLSGIYNATNALLAGVDADTNDERVSLSVEFWNEVAKNIPDWQLAKDRKITASDLRRDYIHAHTLALAALGRVGNHLCRLNRTGWKAKLRQIA
ncbi:MAG: DNA sulfur modification protein DndB [Planctomycetaceae bacterium]